MTLSLNTKNGRKITSGEILSNFVLLNFEGGDFQLSKQSADSE